MIKQLTLPPALDAPWRDRIDRQLDLALASVHWQIKRLIVVVDHDKGTNGSAAEAAFVCRLDARLRSGRNHVLTVHGKDPQACAADVAARLKREIVRDKQLGLLGQVS